MQEVVGCIGISGYKKKLFGKHRGYLVKVGVLLIENIY